MLRSFEQRDVSLTLYRGDPWFRASDVTDILGYRRSALAVRAHVEENTFAPLQNCIMKAWRAMLQNRALAPEASRLCM